MIPKGYTHDGNDKKTGRPEFLVTGQQDMISELLGDSPTAKLWSLLWTWQDGLDGTLSDLANCSGISRTSLYKILPTFLKYDFIIPSRYEKGVQFYKMNNKHYIVKEMMHLLDNHVDSSFQLGIAEDEVKDKLWIKNKKKTKKRKKSKRKA